MEDLWTLFCGQSNCGRNNSETCHQFVFVIQPSSCVNHASIICIDLLLLAFILSIFIYKFSSKKVDELRIRPRKFSTLHLTSAVFNGCLGLAYIAFGIWIIYEKVGNDNSISPIHFWILLFFHEVTWLLMGLTTSLKGEFLPKPTLQSSSILAFLFAGTFCFVSLFAVIENHERLTLKASLDIMSILGASLVLLCTYSGGLVEHESNFYTSLNDSAAQVTRFAKAGLFSKMSFCWLNALMKLGREKILEEDDIPKLLGIDRAGFCYSQFLEQLSKHEKEESPSESSILWTIVACHWREILESGFFALLKILALSAGPLLLNSFIEVAEGKQAFRHEGYLLAFSLFLSKMLESLSQRQWYFRSRLIGLRVRSMLTAAIYKKQLRLSNAFRSGDVMNYTTVDAYRIGEFPFWFHQTWTTCLQICFALVIIIDSVGLASIATLAMIVLTMLCNIPLAKLQHKFQNNLMVAQDERLKAYSEALVNMKVLKLYAWELHFKNVVEALRKVECKWLSAVQSQKAYNFILCWTSPVLASAATFATCYFLGVPLHANNVFTFLSTLRLLQELSELSLMSLVL